MAPSWKRFFRAARLWTERDSCVVSAGTQGPSGYSRRRIRCEAQATGERRSRGSSCRTVASGGSDMNFIGVYLGAMLPVLVCW
jgi:hypothetical protein